MLRIRNLETGYGRLPVLKNVSLHVDKGEIVCLLGANGSGKSTLLAAIAGIAKPKSGEIIFDSTSISGMPAHKVLSRGCSLIPEGRQLFPAMSVEENLILGGYRCHKKKSKAREALPVQKIFELFPILEERRKQMAGTLSGGEQQMLAIGRALMSLPDMILFDEPSMGLAPLVVKTIMHTILRLRESGLTCLLVEQDSRAALSIADRGYVLESGAIMLEGTADDLRNNKDVQRAYLGKEYRKINE